MLREIAQPEIILNNPTLALAIEAGEKQVEILENEIASLEADLHILTSTMRGIARREKILGITPLDTDTLTERAYRVLLRWYDTYPYTRRDLIARLKRIVGDGEFSFDIGFQNIRTWASFPNTPWTEFDGATWNDTAIMGLDKGVKTLKILVELTSKKNVAAIRKLIDDIVPLDIVLDVDLRYKTWASFPAACWGDFAGMVWYEMATIVDEYE
jgi:hypothetical protein